MTTVERDTAPLIDPSITIERDGNDNVCLTIWTNILEGEAVRVRLNPGVAASFLASLAQQTAYSLTRAAASIALGDCPTCKNTRFVKVLDRGRESDAHCPDCTTPETRTIRGRDFPPRPQIGGGLA